MLGERVARLGENGDELIFGELLEHGDHRQPANELGDESERNEILGFDVLEDRVPVDLGKLVAVLDRGKAHDAVSQPPLDDFFEADERAAADEQDAAGVDADVLLLRMLAPALGRDVADGAFENFQQRLLDAFAGNVAREGNVFGLAGDLVDLVDVDNTLLRPLHVEVRVLKEPQDDVLDVFADVAGFSERGGIGDGKGHVEAAGQRAGQQRLARAGIADEQDVALLNLDVAAFASGPFLLAFVHGLGENALVVVVNGHGESLLGVLLADAVGVELFLDFDRFGDRRRSHAARSAPCPGGRIGGEFLFQHALAQQHAVVANVDSRSLDELFDLGVGLSAEAAKCEIGGAGHSWVKGTESASGEFKVRLTSCRANRARPFVRPRLHPQARTLWPPRDS